MLFEGYESSRVIETVGSKFVRLGDGIYKTSLFNLAFAEVIKRMNKITGHISVINKGLEEAPEGYYLIRSCY